MDFHVFSVTGVQIIPDFDSLSENFIFAKPVSKTRSRM